MPDFRDFFLALEPAARERYARRAGTTVGYIRAHLIAPSARRKVPRKRLIEALASASDAKISRADLVAYFYGVNSHEPPRSTHSL